ncbi:MAG: hypothetical protein ABI114_15315 [Rhodanobacter sp.]
MREAGRLHHCQSLREHLAAGELVYLVPKVKNFGFYVRGAVAQQLTYMFQIGKELAGKVEAEFNNMTIAVAVGAGS